jgi:hypothetical protein
VGGIQQQRRRRRCGPHNAFNALSDDDSSEGLQRQKLVKQAIIVAPYCSQLHKVVEDYL